MRVEISNRQVIYGAPKEFRDRIKDSLTFDNPAYKNALRFSRYAYTTIPKYLTYYDEFSVSNGEERIKALSVPIGFSIDYPFDAEIIDKRGRNAIYYPRFLLDLREEQQKAEESYLMSHEMCGEIVFCPRSVIQLPTGKGKSILALHIAHILKAKTLILVHKDDLVVGWTKDAKLCFGEDFEVGLIKAKNRKVGEQITIATVQTLNRMSAEELSTYTSQFDLVVQDECLVGDTFVTLEDGGVKRIKDVTDNDIVLGGEISNKFRRRSKIYTLRSSNLYLSGSPTHPTWCVKKGSKKYTMSDFECKSIKDITSDYYVPIKVYLPHSQKNELSEEEARFVATIMCDGHIDKSPTSRRVKVNVSKDIQFYTKIMSDFARYSGSKLKTSLDCRNNTTLWFTDPSVKELLVNKWGVPIGKKSDIISIPDFLYYAPLSSIKAFIETCFSCEGDFSISKCNSLRINFNTASKDFAIGISLLLRKFGIVTTIQRIPKLNKNHHAMWRLSVSGVFYNKFADTFSLIHRKSSNLRNKKTQDKRFVGEYYLSPVLKVIEEDYEDYVYDFTVNSKEHSFIANGAYTHNCHHVAINMFNIIDKFSSAFKLGLSATPKRSDGLNFVFDIFFGGLCYKYDYSQSDEDISPVEVIVKSSTFKYEPFLYKGMIYNLYAFSPSDLPESYTLVKDIPYEKRPQIPFLNIDNEMVLDSKYMLCVCKDIIKEYKEGHSCIALFNQKEHIRKYKDFLKQFIPEEQILLYYGDAKESSEELMQKAESKECLVTLATYAKATEGTNVKSWEVEFLVSSLNNEKNVEQATGRIRRTKEGKLNPVRVYDYRVDSCYSIRNHINTRIQTYRKLHYSIKDQNGVSNNSLFTRGFK